MRTVPHKLLNVNGTVAADASNLTKTFHNNKKELCEKFQVYECCNCEDIYFIPAAENAKQGRAAVDMIYLLASLPTACRKMSRSERHMFYFLCASQSEKQYDYQRRVSENKNYDPAGQTIALGEASRLGIHSYADLEKYKERWKGVQRLAYFFFSPKQLSREQAIAMFDAIEDTFKTQLQPMAQKLKDIECLYIKDRGIVLPLENRST